MTEDQYRERLAAIERQTDDDVASARRIARSRIHIRAERSVRYRYLMDALAEYVMDPAHEAILAHEHEQTEALEAEFASAEPD